MDAGDEVRVGRDALDRLEQRGGLVLRQAGQGEPLHAAGPLELAQPRERRVTAVQLVRAQRHRDEDPFRAQGPDEEAQGLAGGRVRPVDVLDQHEDGRDRGQPPQHADQGVEQAGLEPGLLERRPRRPGIQRRDEPGEVGAGRADHGLEAFGVQLADELAEDLDDRAVRQALITDVRARPAEDEHAASLGGRSQLGREPALAHAGLAGDQQVGGRPVDGGIERGERRVELGPASDRDGADEASGHAGDHTEGDVPAPHGAKDHDRLGHSAAAVRREVEANGDRGGLGARGHAELAQDVRHVDARGVLADEQLVGDLAVGPAQGDQGQHLALALRQAEGIGGRRGAGACRGGRGEVDPGPLGQRLDRLAQGSCAQVRRRRVGRPQGRRGRRAGRRRRDSASPSRQAAYASRYGRMTLAQLSRAAAQAAAVRRSPQARVLGVREGALRDRHGRLRGRARARASGRGSRVGPHAAPRPAAGPRRRPAGRVATAPARRCRRRPTPRSGAVGR